MVIRNTRRRNRAGKRSLRKMRRKKIKKFTKATKCIVRGPTVIPDRYFVKMKYTDTIVLGNGVLQYANWAFRGNSLFDPDFTSVGHQPMGYDQLTALYNFYTVFASKIEVRFINTSSTNTAKVYIYPSTVNSGPTDPNLAEEASYSKRSFLSLNTAQGSALIKSFMGSRKIFGVKKIEDFMTDYGGSTTTNPATQWYWQIMAYGTAAAIPLNSISCDVKITYWCEWYNRVQLPLS